MQSTSKVLEEFFFQNTEPFSPSVDPTSTTETGKSTIYKYTDSTITVSGLPKYFYFASDSGDNTTKDLDGTINRAADISLNLTRFKQEFKYLKEQTGVYGDDILDDNGNPLQKNIKSLTEARKSDGQIMLVQQNTMYIIGIITTATILITAIMIAK